MAHVNYFFVPAYSDLTVHSSDIRPPHRRIYFSIFKSQQGRGELFLPPAEDRSIRPETVMVRLTRPLWFG